MPEEKKVKVEELTIEKINEEVSKTAQKAVDDKLADVNSKIENVESGIKDLVTVEVLTDKVKDFRIKPGEGNDFTEDEVKFITEEITKQCGPDSEIMSAITKQGNTLKEIKENGLLVQSPSRPDDSMRGKIARLLDHIFKSDDYKDFANKNYIGGTNKYSIGQDGKVNGYDEFIKDKQEAEKAVSVTSDHTGTVLISDVRMNVRDIPLRKTHIRDLMSVTPTAGTQIVAPEVTDYTDAFTQSAIMVAENTEAGLSVFKTKENTWSLKRIARAMEVSKRYFKTNGLTWVMTWILNRLPDQVQFVEDFQILFGDGAGNNVDGLNQDSQQFGTLTGTYAAAAISSVATYDGGTKAIVTFAAAHGLKNGDSVTFASATAAVYNNAFTNIIVQNQFSIVITVAYVAEADTSAWTGTWFSYWYHSIESAQEFDVLTVAKALLNAGEYEATAAVLHSSTVEKLGLLKGTDAHYVGVSRDAAGRLNVNAMPIAVTNAMPAGHFLVGDFQRAVELCEYTPLSIQISEDTTDKKKNQVTVIVEEEIILPKYNPYWFMYGVFSDALTAIEDPGEEVG